MEIIGIICEYNPFHNGHKYHIDKIRKLYPEAIIVLVLNGYFLERGDLSILTKEDKTKIALEMGVDIVTELPFLYGTQSADTFAEKAIEILNNLHVTRLIFGSESNDIKMLEKLALKQMDLENAKCVKELLDNGLNYPTALAKSLQTDFSFLPNDLLGISYIKAILKNNYKIKYECIKRTSDYHDIKSNKSIVSASNIREKLHNHKDILKYVPSNVVNKIINIDYGKLFCLLKYKVTVCNELEIYLDVTEGIDNRLKKCIVNASNLDELIEMIKTKRYTYNKIRRMIIHILLEVKKEHAQIKMDYIRILGFNTRGKKYLNEIKKNLDIPININIDSLIYKYELKASLLYDLINDTNTINFEKSKKPIRFE